MANPNIVNVTSILGNTSSNLISSTDDPFATALVANAASSGKVYKINSIVVANVDGSAAADITIKIFPNDDLTGTGTAIAYTATGTTGQALLSNGSSPPTWGTAGITTGKSIAMAMIFGF